MGLFGFRMIYRLVWVLLIAVVVLPIVDIGGLGGISRSTAWAGSAVIGGRRMSCRAAKVVKTGKSPVVGYAQKGVIVVNPKLMRKYPSVTRRIIFLHECGHQYVGADETAADCWAVKIAKRQGWLSEAGVKQVCKSFYNSPGGSYHLPGPARCQAMLQCYRSAKGRKSKKRRSARRKKKK